MDWKKLLTIKHLRTLNAISEAGSLANAAEILNLSPPAVTIQLNQIEEILNVRILERGPNGFIKISNVGYELLKLHKQIDNLILRSFQRIEQLKIGKTGYVKLGAVTTAQYFCPWIIAKAKKEFPDLLLFDGNMVPPNMKIKSESIIKGDKLIPEISAASIVAKVVRDAHMKILDNKYPGFNFKNNAGYGVKSHLSALKTLGVTPIHRRTFKPIHNILCEEN